LGGDLGEAGSGGELLEQGGDMSTIDGDLGIMFGRGDLEPSCLGVECSGSGGQTCSTGDLEFAVSEKDLGASFSEADVVLAYTRGANFDIS